MQIMLHKGLLLATVCRKTKRGKRHPSNLQSLAKEKHAGRVGEDVDDSYTELLLKYRPQSELKRFFPHTDSGLPMLCQLFHYGDKTPEKATSKSGKLVVSDTSVHGQPSPLLLGPVAMKQYNPRMWQRKTAYVTVSRKPRKETGKSYSFRRHGLSSLFPTHRPNMTSPAD